MELLQRNLLTLYGITTKKFTYFIWNYYREIYLIYMELLQRNVLTLYGITTKKFTYFI